MTKQEKKYLKELLESIEKKEKQLNNIVNKIMDIKTDLDHLRIAAKDILDFEDGRGIRRPYEDPNDSDLMLLFHELHRTID